jgi:hypothetical protein
MLTGLEGRNTSDSFSMSAIEILAKVLCLPMAPPTGLLVVRGCSFPLRPGDPSSEAAFGVALVVREEVLLVAVVSLGLLDELLELLAFIELGNDCEEPLAAFELDEDMTQPFVPFAAAPFTTVEGFVKLCRVSEELRAAASTLMIIPPFADAVVALTRDAKVSAASSVDGDLLRGRTGDPSFADPSGFVDGAVGMPARLG